MLSKGEDGKLYVLVDGREELVFRNIENIDIDWGLGTEEHMFVGAENTVVTEVNNPVRITVRLKPDGPGFGRLIELRRGRGGSLATRSEVRFDITCSVNHGDAGRDRWAFPDLKIGDGSSNIPGKGQYVNGALTFVCDSGARRL
jgi:hypothetical protein